MTHHPFHQTKFRWTENLTSRFIQLRKENGNLFTGRKYSAQAGWEHILQQMRREFPTIMADVHYRVLKKKWSNLLQQYKELKNPVHGDRNKSDDVSWPFYGAIDEVLGFGSANRRNEDPDFDSVNPHEFLCLSVTPEEPASPPDDVKNRQESEIDIESNSVIALHQRIRNLRKDFSIEIEKLPETMTTTTTTATTTRRLLGHRSSGQSRIADVMNCQDASEALVSRLPPATELSIKTVRTSSSVPSIRVKDFSKDLRNSPPDLSPISVPNRGRFLRDVLAVVKQNGIHNSSSVIEDVEEVEEEVVEEEEEEEEEEEDDDDGAEEEEEDDDDGEEEESKKLQKLNEVQVGGREEEEIEEIEEEEEELEEEDDDEGDDEVLLDEEVRIRPRKIRRIERQPPQPPPPPLSVTERERGLERRLDEFIEYTKRRDEENYRIMTRILNAVEKIADKQ